MKPWTLYFDFGPESQRSVTNALAGEVPQVGDSPEDFIPQVIDWDDNGQEVGYPPPLPPIGGQVMITTHRDKQGASSYATGCEVREVVVDYDPDHPSVVIHLR